MKFLKENSNHFNLCLRLPDELLCFAEHFDSTVPTLGVENIILSKVLQKFKKNPEIFNGLDFMDVLNGKEGAYVRTYKNGEYEIVTGKLYDNRGYGSPNLPMDNDMLKDMQFIYTTRNGYNLIMTLYKVYNEEELRYEKLDEKVIKMSKTDGFILPCSENEMNEFLAKDEGMVRTQKELFQDAVYDCYSYYPKFVDKYTDFRRIIDWYLDFPFVANRCEMFWMHYWLSKRDYYDYIDVRIQRGDTSNLYRTNPYLTGEAVPTVADIPSINNRGMEFLKQLNMLDSGYIANFSRLEKHPKVGIDGLNIILECCCKFKKVNENRSYSNSFSFFGFGYTQELANYFYQIFETFDITPKNLIDRIIREAFNYHITPFDFLIIVCDYIEMCKQFNINPEKKIPKDVLRRHDILSTKVKEIKNKAIAEQFKLQITKNKKLLDNIPNSKYTIISPENSNDLIEEGFRMNHCVGSYGYRVANGTSKIFFVRNRSDINTPVATLELNENNQMVQISAFANKTPQKDVLDFVNEWLKTIL